MGRSRLALAACLVLACGVAGAQRYPEKPVRMVVPFQPGGGSDTVGRALARGMSERFGQPIVVENRVGAAGSIGAEFAARAPADGYTILLGSTSELTQYPVVNPKIRYDPMRDFAPIGMVAIVPLVFIVHPALPVRSVAEFTRLARGRPGQIDFGSAGVGATSHLAVEHYMMLAGVKLNHVPYKGSPQATAELLAGQIQMAIATLPSAISLIQANRLKALAVSSEKRVPGLPQVPTMQEAGVKDYVNVLWTGLLAPRGTPAGIVKQLHGEIGTALEHPEVRKALDTGGASPQTSSPEAFAAFIAAELEKWKRVVKQADIKP
jgi:tripartite-type tricarboxylate transporter receptor subunit TctC